MARAYETLATAHAELSVGQRRLLMALGASTFMVSLDARVVAPLLPSIAQELGISIARAGYLVSFYLLPYGAFQLLYGPLADRVGKLRVAAWAMAAFSVGTALCGAFTSFSAVLLARAFTGAAAAALIPLTIAYIGDVVPYARRQTALATLMASAGAAQAISMGAGGLLAAVLSWRGLFPLLGALAGLVTLVLFGAARGQGISDGARRNPSYRAALQTDLTPLLVVVCVEGALFMGGFPFLSGLLEHRFGLQPWGIGLLLALGGASQVLVARALPALLRRWSEPELVSIGGGAMGAAYLIAALAPSMAWIGIASLLLGAGFSTCHSTLQTRATEVFPSGRGSALSLFAFSLFLGGGVGSLGLGWLLERTGYGLGFAVTALCWVPLTIAASKLVRRPLPAHGLRVPAAALERPSR